MAPVITQPGAFKIDGKRFYLPGCSLSGICPKCSERFERDFREHYLAYPDANEPFDLCLWCPKCDHEWVVRVRLNISLEIVKEKA